MPKRKLRKVTNYGKYANRFWIGNAVKFPGGYGVVQKVFYNLEDFWIYYGIINEVTGESVMVIDRDCQDLQP